MTDRGLATQLRLMLMRGTYGSDRQISDVFGFLKNGSDRLHQRCVWIHNAVVLHSPLVCSDCRAGLLSAPALTSPGTLSSLKLARRVGL